MITIPQPQTTITPLCERPAWKALQQHHVKIQNVHLRQLFAEDPQRGQHFAFEALGFYFDYSKNRITNETIRLLLELAEQSRLREHINAMFGGEKINVTEKRAVLHVALRATKDDSIMLDGANVVPLVHAVLDRMTGFANRLRSGEWRGYTGKRIRNVINIGIGGSDLGPVMAYEALKYYSPRSMNFRFVSNVDGTDFAEATQDLNAGESLFVISSKTFTTLETMTNARTRPASGCGRPWEGRRRRSRAISSQSRPTALRSRSSVLTPPTCLAFGTGWAGATRWTPRLACRQ